MGTEVATRDHDRSLPNRALGEATAARVGLGRTGVSVRTADQLQFQLDHATARDAVGSQLDVNALAEAARHCGLNSLLLQSAVGRDGKGGMRHTYLRRPDLGRRLHPESAAVLEEQARDLPQEPEVVFVIADGLSALAIERHAPALLEAASAKLLAEGWRIGPVCVVTEARVAIGDEIGALLGAGAVAVLIGERPGLSAPDSLGVYVTWAPRVGRTDAERNCISNVRHEGLSYREAAERLCFYLRHARAGEPTGVALKWDPLAARLERLGDGQ